MRRRKILKEKTVEEDKKSEKPKPSPDPSITVLTYVGL